MEAPAARRWKDNLVETRLFAAALFAMPQSLLGLDLALFIYLNA
jgi:hypothetical protein